jgi:hypothetical protein
MELDCVFIVNSKGTEVKNFLPEPVNSEMSVFDWKDGFSSWAVSYYLNHSERFRVKAKATVVAGVGKRCRSEESDEVEAENKIGKKT